MLTQHHTYTGAFLRAGSDTSSVYTPISHTLSRLVEQDAAVTRGEIFSEIYFDIVFKLI